MGLTLTRLYSQPRQTAVLSWQISRFGTARSRARRTFGPRQSQPFGRSPHAQGWGSAPAALPRARAVGCIFTSYHSSTASGLYACKNLANSKPQAGVRAGGGSARSRLGPPGSPSPPCRPLPPRHDPRPPHPPRASCPPPGLEPFLTVPTGDGGAGVLTCQMAKKMSAAQRTSDSM